MTPEQVRDVLEDLLLLRQAKMPGSGIKAVTTIGDSYLVITFTDGSMARLGITVSPAPEGGQE